MSRSTSARSTAAEQRFRRLLLVYPPEWRVEHGEALLGTLLDAAEARGERGPTPAAATALVQEGLRQRVRRALSAEVRATVASVAAGTGIGFSLAYFAFFAWTQPDFYSGRVIVGPVWFLPASLGLALCALTGRPVLRLAAWAVATTVLLAVPLLQLGPFPSVLRSGAVSEGESFLRPGLASPGMLIPADSGNVAVLLVLAALTIVGRPGGKQVLLGAVVAGLISTLWFLGAVQLVHRFEWFSDAFLWHWNPLQRAAYGTPVPILAPAAVLLLASPVLRRRPAASLLCLLGAVLLVTGAVASSLAGPIPSGE